ncbi:MAG: hypothetical protein HEEMFOPI_01220 [Holosporales bacterium]
MSYLTILKNNKRYLASILILSGSLFYYGFAFYRNDFEEYIFLKNKNSSLKKEFKNIYNDALLEIKKGDFEEAIKLYKKLLKKLDKEKDKDIMAFFSIDLYEIQDDYGISIPSDLLMNIEECRIKCKNQESLHKLAYIEACQNLEVGKIEEAQNAFIDLQKRLYKSDPLYFACKKKFYYCQWILGKDDKVLLDLEKAYYQLESIGHIPEQISYLKLLALMHIEACDLEKGELFINKGLDLCKKSKNRIQEISLQQLHAYFLVKNRKFNDAMFVIKFCENNNILKNSKNLLIYNDIIKLQILASQKQHNDYNELYLIVSKKIHSVKNKNIILILLFELEKILQNNQSCDNAFILINFIQELTQSYPQSRFKFILH